MVLAGLLPQVTTYPAEKSGGCGVSLLVIMTHCDLNQYYCEMLARTSVATLVGRGAKSFRAR